MGKFGILGGLASLIPGVGPVLGPVLGGLGVAGDMASQMAQGRAAGRVQEAELQQGQDKLGIDRALAMNQQALQGGQLDLSQRQFGLNADSERLRQAIRLAALGGVQDMQIDVPSYLKPHMATVTGGLRPSALQGREEIVAAMRPRVLEALMKGETFDPLTMEPVPGVSELPQSGKLDTFLNVLGGIGAGASGASEILSGMSKPKPKPSDIKTTGVYGAPLPPVQGFR